MRYDYPRYPTSRFSLSRYFPPAVKWLLLINTGIFLLTQTPLILVLGDFATTLQSGISRHLVLHTGKQFEPWQLVTYLFLHGGAMHLLFNMLSIWMFGSPLERDWGTRRFVKFYATCGIGAGLFVLLFDFFRGVSTSTVGASGAIFGLLVAFGMLYPRATIIFFIFPIEARFFVMIYAALVFLGVFQPNSGVSNIAHLGGLVIGFIMVKARRWDIGFNPDSLRRRYQQWKLQRAKKKFQVYLKKHGSKRDPWVH